MTAEKIIDQIKKDAQKEVKQILKVAESQAMNIIDIAKNEAEVKSANILLNGKKQSENIKKILISKTNRDMKRGIIRAKETIIDDCFTKACHKLSALDIEEYKTIVSKLMEDRYKNLGEQYTIVISKDIDRKIAEDVGLKVTGTVEASGGIILRSSDGRIALDNTFDAILRRKKDKIRAKVGKLLFS